MRLGLFMMPLHSGRLGYTEMFQQDMEAALLADRLGYDEVFVGEHWSARVEPISDPLQFMSALIPLATRITFGTGVLNLPHHHPAKIAADVALFDHMSRGRFVMGIGPGGLPSDVELFQTVDKNRGKMMLECLEMAHRIWASEPPYDIEGEFWRVRIVDTVQDDLQIGPIPKPYQKPHPPVAVSAMSPGSGLAKLAGERGWSVISANFNPDSNTRSHWQRYLEGCAEAGRRPDPSAWRVARSILVTETDSQARDYLANPDNSLRGYFHYLRTQLTRAGSLNIFKPDPTTPDDAITDDFCLDTMAIVGSPRTVADRLAALMDDVGPFGTLLAAFHEWDDAPLWRRSMQLLAEDVLPRLTAAARGRHAGI